MAIGGAQIESEAHLDRMGSIHFVCDDGVVIRFGCVEDCVATLAIKVIG